MLCFCFSFVLFAELFGFFPDFEAVLDKKKAEEAMLKWGPFLARIVKTIQVVLKNLVRNTS